MSDISGATSIEYAMVACFISIVIVGSVTAIGGSVKGFFDDLLARMP
jgi:Flp pilus assembly pilin Flp